MCKTFLKIYLNWPPPRKNCKRLLIWNLKKQQIGQVHVRRSRNLNKLEHFAEWRDTKLLCLQIIFWYWLWIYTNEVKRLNVLKWWLVSLVPGELFAPDVIPCPPTTWADTYKVRSSCHRLKTWKHRETTVCAKRSMSQQTLYKIILFFMAFYKEYKLVCAFLSSTLISTS